MQLVNLAGWYGPDYNDDAQIIPICNTAYNALSQVNANSFFYTLGTDGVQELGNSDYESLDEYLKAEESMSDGDLYIILSKNEDYGPQLIAKVTSTERYLYTFKQCFLKQTDNLTMLIICDNWHDVHTHNI